MQCFTEEDLDRYLDGSDLPGVEEHLAECGRCRSLLEEMRSLRREIEELEPDQPPPELAAMVMSRVRATRLGWSIRIAAVASLLSSIAAGYLASIMITGSIVKAFAAVMGNVGMAGPVLRLLRGMLADGRVTLSLVWGIPEIAYTWIALLLMAVGLVLTRSGSKGTA